MFSLVAILVLLGVGLLLVGYGTLARNKWGINLSKVCCPNCNTPLTGTRRLKTRSLKQAMWGGYTCPVCGAEIDKWVAKHRGVKNYKVTQRISPLRNATLASSGL